MLLHVFGEQAPHNLNVSLMRVEIFFLSCSMSAKLIIINTRDVQACLRASRQVILVKLIICDACFIRTNGVERKTFVVYLLADLCVSNILISEHQWFI